MNRGWELAQLLAEFIDEPNKVSSPSLYQLQLLLYANWWNVFQSTCDHAGAVHPSLIQALKIRILSQPLNPYQHLMGAKELGKFDKNLSVTSLSLNQMLEEIR